MEKTEEKKAKKRKTAHTSGKRKTAIARATLRDGVGNIRINTVLLENFGTDLMRMKIREPLLIMKDFIDLDKVNIDIKVKGGGPMGQTDAIRTSICKAVIEFLGNGGDKVREVLVKYDRSLIAGDSRRTEPHKPSRSGQGPRAKRQKSYR